MTYRRELTQADLERMRVPPRYWDVTLHGVHDSGGTIESKPPNPRAVIRSYLERIGEFHAKGAGLFLWGDNAVGKTCAAVLLLKESRRRAHSCLFLSAAEIHRAVISRTGFDEEQTLWERAFNVDVLLLDDLGKGMVDSTGFQLRMLDELFRHRNGRQSVTHATTNLTRKSLLSGDFLKQSTLSTIKECCVLMPFAGEDQRAPQGEELMGMLK